MKKEKKILHQIKVAPLEQKNATFARLCEPLKNIELPDLKSNGNRKMQFGFEAQLKSLMCFHLEKYSSGRELVEKINTEIFCRTLVGSEIQKSSFFEAMNHRGLEQMEIIFSALSKKAQGNLPCEYEELGKLLAMDVTLIDATFSMLWADYRKKAKKAKVHLGFDVNHKIPRCLMITDGKSDEKKQIPSLVEKGETIVLDRWYHCHKAFDLWQEENIYFISRIKANTIKTVIQENKIEAESCIFYDAVVLLGKENINQTKNPIRLVGYKIGGTIFWVATNRFDLSASQVAFAYKLRWDIETFFAWWKQYLSVYPLIVRSQYGFALQILSGLVFYLLLALFCRTFYFSLVTLSLFRQIQSSIRNEFVLSFHIWAYDHPLLKPDKPFW